MMMSDSYEAIDCLMYINSNLVRLIYFLQSICVKKKVDTNNKIERKMYLSTINTSINCNVKQLNGK